MTTPLIIQNIAKHIALTKEQETQFLSLLEFKKIKKKHFLAQEGEISKGPVFVTEGILRSYTIDKNGFEHILQFAPADWWMVDMFSLVTGKPGKLYMDAIDATEVLLFPEKRWINYTSIYLLLSGSFVYWRKRPW